ncbi:MAG: helix-turn-helix domain-containing protein [Nitratireductor sp.]|nr:helix-turn-helix domain-containing protein [Nitratireductor sp.]
MALMTPAEAAAQLGISSRQLRDLTTDGEIPFVNIGRGERATRRYDPIDIAAFIMARKKTACPSISAPAHRSTATTSAVVGIDFQARRTARRNAKLKSSKTGSKGR